ncbi:MAG TPA: hypothetical protein VNB49_18675 [Candidatus Dormibacteraeota bacterium]|nr:hypothetical protein [Candidatus Dormibacteraeota bacterium]
MKRLFSVAFSLLFVLPFAGAPLNARTLVSALPEQTNKSGNTAYLYKRRRRHLRRGERPRRPGIRGSFKQAGKSAGSGGSGFGKNIARGKPIKAGRRLGKGMGGFGKHTGKGVGKTGKRVVKH